jgi:hypothetical protein
MVTLTKDSLKKGDPAKPPAVSVTELLVVDGVVVVVVVVLVLLLLPPLQFTITSAVEINSTRLANLASIEFVPVISPPPRRRC